jgi:hypothetical protein
LSIFDDGFPGFLLFRLIALKELQETAGGSEMEIATEKRRH